MSIFKQLPKLKNDKNNKFLLKLIELLQLFESKVDKDNSNINTSIDNINNEIGKINQSIDNINYTLDEIEKDKFDIKSIFKTQILYIQPNAPLITVLIDAQSLHNSNFYNYKFTFNHAINWDLVVVFLYKNEEIRYTINGLNNTFNTDNYINVDINYFNLGENATPQISFNISTGIYQNYKQI